jgi:hypothetical protein
VAQKASQITHLGDVSQEKRKDKSLMLAGFCKPTVVRFPLIFSRVALENRLANFVEGEPAGERVGLGFAIPDAGAAYECIKGQDSHPIANLNPASVPLAEGLAGGSLP